MTLQATLTRPAVAEKPRERGRKKVELPPIGLNAEVEQTISRAAYQASRRLWLERHCPYS